MNVNLSPVLDQFVAELVKTGHYQTQSEVLREGLRLLKEREASKQNWLAETRKAIAQGIEEADRGVFVDGPAAFQKIRRGSASLRRKRK